jgi:Carboxypeptidase regulatory-like domain
MNRHPWLRCVAVASIFLGAMYAQGLGTIVGPVTDPSGSLIPNATVRVPDEGTSQSRETKSNAQGYYVCTTLRPATYTVSVETPGFATSVRKGIILQADQTATVDVALGLQRASEPVTVEAPPPQVDTSTSTMSEVVDRRRIADEGNTKTFPVAVTVCANGSRQNQTSYRLDGANNNDIYTNVNQPFPFPDAVQESAKL